MRSVKQRLIILLCGILIFASSITVHARHNIITKDEISSNINTSEYIRADTDLISDYSVNSSLINSNIGKDIRNVVIKYNYPTSISSEFLVTKSNNTQACFYGVKFYIGTYDLSRGSYLGMSWKLSFDENYQSASSKEDGTLSTSDANGNLKFNCWKNEDTGKTYSSHEGMSAFNFTSTHNSTVTLTAQWFSETRTDFDDVSVPGYDFLGWYMTTTSTDRITSVTINPATVAYDTTLYAHWKARNYTFTFDYNKPVEGNSNPQDGGNVNNRTKGYNGTEFANSATHDVVKNGSDTAVYTFDDKFGNLPTPTLIGWTFEGWFLRDDEGNYHKVENGTDFNYTIINKDKETLKKSSTEYTWTIVARWRPNEYSVTYTGNYNTSGESKTVEHLIYDVDYNIKENIGFTNFARKHKLTFHEEGGSDVEDQYVEHSFKDWVFFESNTGTTTYTLYTEKDFNTKLSSSVNHLEDTYAQVGTPYWGSDTEGKKTMDEHISSHSLGTHFNENETFRNLCAVDKGNVELRAQWKINRITLPETERTQFKFLSWYIGEQSIDTSLREKDDVVYKKTTLLGNSGDAIYILQDTDAYAWYNQAPIFEDIYTGQFFEGQNVSISDLLSLVSVYDYEDDYYNIALEEIDHLPEVSQEDIYLPIHIDASVKNSKTKDKSEEDSTEEETEEDNSTEEVDEVDSIVINADVWIDGMPYRFNSEEWEATDDSGIYINKSTGRKHYTTEKKMQLEDAINSSNLVLKIKNIEYEYKDGVAQTIWDADSDFTEGGQFWIDDGTQVDYTESELATNVLDTSTSRFNYSVLMTSTSENLYTKAKEAKGQFRITYQVTDNGVWNGNTLTDSDYYNEYQFSGDNTEVTEGIEDATAKISSAITIEYARACTIQYNNAPLIYLRDEIMYEGAEDWDSIIDKQVVIDAEDCINNPPFWYTKESDNTTGVTPKGDNPYTYDNLQASLYEVGIWGCIIDDSFLVDHPNAQELMNEWEKVVTVDDFGSVPQSERKTTRDIKALKDSNDKFMGSDITNSEIYSAILTFNVEFDAVDQWGKHANGVISSDGFVSIDPKTGEPTGEEIVPPYDSDQDVTYEPENPDGEKDPIPDEYWQDLSQRSITIYKVNDNTDTTLTVANVAERIRYVNYYWAKNSSIVANSYWGDSSYGYNALRSILAIGENISGYNKYLSSNNKLVAVYDLTAVNKNGHSLNVHVKDYTNLSDK
jgi:uncharacterized repeat protein (TIGR02543 family)